MAEKENKGKKVEPIINENGFYCCGICESRLSYDDDDPSYGHDEECECCGAYNEKSKCGD